MALQIGHCGGFDEDFVGEVKDTLICQICSKPLRDPHLTVCCSHNICESCLDQWSKRNQETECCPLCRSTGEEFQHVPNIKTKREVNALKVRCSNHKEGCEWVGELGTLQNHLELKDGCGYVNIKCPNNCSKLLSASDGLFDDDPLALPQKGDTFVMRKDLQHHFETECEERPYQCAHCGEKDRFKQITTGHYQQCPELPLDCPKQGDVEQIRRINIDQHLKECPLEVVSCPFEEVGCRPVSLQRKDIDEHMEKCFVNHQLLMLKSIQEKSERTKKEWDRKMAVITANIDALLVTCTEEQRLPLLSIRSVIDDSYCLKRGGASLSLQMTSVSKYKRTNVWYSPPFYLGDVTGLKLRLRIHPNGVKEGARTHLSLVVECLERVLHEPIKVECGCINVQAIVSKQADKYISYDADCIVCECSTVTSSTVRQYYKKYEFVPLKTMQRNDDTMQFLVKWGSYSESCVCNCHDPGNIHKEFNIR